MDDKWEFPRRRLILGELLGEGEFGKVLQGKAMGIAGDSGKYLYLLSVNPVDKEKPLSTSRFSCVHCELCDWKRATVEKFVAKIFATCFYIFKKNWLFDGIVYLVLK